MFLYVLGFKNLINYSNLSSRSVLDFILTALLTIVKYLEDWNNLVLAGVVSQDGPQRPFGFFQVCIHLPSLLKLKSHERNHRTIKENAVKPKPIVTLPTGLLVYC